MADAQVPTHVAAQGRPLAACGLARLVVVWARLAPAASAVQISHLALASCARLARHFLGVVPAPRQWAEGARVWELCASVGLSPCVGGGVLPRGVVPILARGAARQVLRGHRSVATTCPSPFWRGACPAAVVRRRVVCDLVPLLPGRPVWVGAAWGRAACVSPFWRGACPAAVGRRRAVCEPRASGGSPCGLVRLVACRARLVCHLLGVVPALRLWAEGARSVTFVGRSATMRFSESSTQSTPMASWRGRMSVFFGEGRKRDANLDMVHVPVDLTAVFTE